MAERPLVVLAPCRARDLSVLEIVARWLPCTLPLKEFVVVSPDADCARIQKRLGKRARVGDVPDLIESGSTGLLFNPLDRVDMARGRGGEWWLVQAGSAITARLPAAISEANCGRLEI